MPDPTSDGDDFGQRIWVSDPQNVFELAPRNSMKFAEFEHRTGLIKTRPASWKDYFAPVAHDLQGS